MLKSLWFYAKITAFKWKLSPVGLFLTLHTILWCDIAWAVCMGIYAALDIPAVLHSMDTLLTVAYSGIFMGIIGGAIYLMHEDLV